MQINKKELGKKTIEKETLDEVGESVAAKLSSGDVKGAVRILASGNNILHPCQDLIHTLIAKYHDAPSDSRLPSPPTLEEIEPNNQVVK